MITHPPGDRNGERTVFDADGAAESRYQLYWDRALFQCSSTCTGADERIGGGAVQSPVCVYGRVGIGEVFEKGEADRIYLNFSDPWPKAATLREGSLPPHTGRDMMGS